MLSEVNKEKANLFKMLNARTSLSVTAGESDSGPTASEGNIEFEGSRTIETSRRALALTATIQFVGK